MAGAQEHVPIAKLLKDVQTASTNSGLLVGAITLEHFTDALDAIKIDSSSAESNRGATEALRRAGQLARGIARKLRQQAGKDAKIISKR